MSNAAIEAREVAAAAARKEEAATCVSNARNQLAVFGDKTRQYDGDVAEWDAGQASLTTNLANLDRNAGMCTDEVELCALRLAQAERRGEFGSALDAPTANLAAASDRLTKTQRDQARASKKLAGIKAKLKEVNAVRLKIAAERKRLQGVVVAAEAAFSSV